MNILVKTFVIAMSVLAMTGAGAAAPTNQSSSQQAEPDINWCATGAVDSPKEGKKLVDHLENTVSTFLAQKNFTALFRMFDQRSDPGCKCADGRHRLMVMKDGFSTHFKKTKDWSTSWQTVEAVKKAQPNKPLPVLLEAEYWLAYAWDARGTGYASSVSKDGWKLFGERLAKAKKTLDDSKEYASSSPVWYQEMIVVLSASGAPQRERDAVFVAGVDKFEWYLPIYFTRSFYLAPWWGGDWDSIENMAVWSANKTMATMGDAMYARLYWNISGYSDQVRNVFKDTKASWPKMKKGFEDLAKQYPDSKMNLNAYARFACEADDRATYLKLRKRIENNLTDEGWSKARRHEVCDGKFGYQL
jgi:hypothetical protein